MPINVVDSALRVEEYKIQKRAEMVEELKRKILRVVVGRLSVPLRELLDETGEDRAAVQEAAKELVRDSLLTYRQATIRLQDRYVATEKALHLAKALRSVERAPWVAEYKIKRWAKMRELGRVFATCSSCGHHWTTPGKMLPPIIVNGYNEVVCEPCDQRNVVELLQPSCSFKFTEAHTVWRSDTGECADCGSQSSRLWFWVDSRKQEYLHTGCLNCNFYLPSTVYPCRLCFRGTQCHDSQKRECPSE